MLVKSLSQEAEVMISLSNLLKYNNVIQKSNARIIDSNELVNEKIEYYRTHMQGQGFVEGLNIKQVEVVGEQNEEVPAVKTEEELQEEANAIIEEAKKQAEQILKEARLEADKLKDLARENGKMEGFDEGYREGTEKVKQLEQELQEKEKQLEEDYRHKREQMEPELVDVLVDVFDKVTHTIAEDKKDMILTLVDSVMSQVELSHNFLIRVSKDDYQFLVDNKDRITSLASASGNNANIDIFEDVTLKRNECIIETDVGIFDCSLDIQLENLIKDIKLLSCV